MRKLIILAFLTFLFNRAISQEINLNRIADSIESEGKTLYRSEFASWYVPMFLMLIAKFNYKRPEVTFHMTPNPE
ncbi:MAG TPA: hypothetical protein VIM89_11655 [Mucilaginibacter sp.]